MSRWLVLSLLWLTALASPGVVQDSGWPQFGGPSGLFAVAERPLTLAGEGEPPLRWSRALGEGFSGISAEGDRLFTMYRRGGDEVVVAVDASSGRTVWEHASPAGPVHPEQDLSNGPGPHATPAVGGGVVCAAGTSARLRCLEALDGRLLWARDLQSEDQATVVVRGYSSSPVFAGDAVILQAGGENRALMAFDRRTGSMRWRSGSYQNTNSSPLVATIGGARQVVAFMAGVIAGFDAGSGAQLWSHPHKQRFDDNIARPLVLNGDTVVASSALDGGTRAVRVWRDGQWRVEERWHQPRAGVYYTNIAPAAGLVIGSSGGLGPTLLTAVRVETGSIAWQSRAIPRSQVLAVGGGRLLLRDEEGGLALASVGVDGVELLARVRLLAEGPPSPPTLVGTILYARDRQRIVAVDLARPR